MFLPFLSSFGFTDMFNRLHRIVRSDQFGGCFVRSNDMDLPSSSFMFDSLSRVSLVLLEPFNSSIRFCAVRQSGAAFLCRRWPASNNQNKQQQPTVGDT